MKKKEDWKRVVFLLLLSPRTKTLALTCSIKQIKEHLKEYVSPSKASNNCLIQFSPATYKQVQNMFNKTVFFNQQQLEYPPTTKKFMPSKMPEWVVAHSEHPCVCPCHIFSIPLHVVLRHPDQNKLSLRYCKHFQGEICMQASIYTKPTMNRGFCPSLA